MSSSNSSRKDESLWDKLEVGRIYVLLFVRSHPPKADDFHWGIYAHTEKKGGRKYHIKTLGNGWIADHGPTSGVFKSFLLVGLFHIATIPAEQTWFDYLDEIMRTYDNQLNNTGTTCRVWSLWIFQLLQSHNILLCSDLDALEAEIFEFGNKYAADAADGKQPRPIKTSKICRGLK